MKTDKYDELDARIIAACAAGRRGRPLYDYAVGVEAARIAGLEDREPMRVIDARLQVLKRAGKIKFKRGPKARWVQVPKDD